jgi:hypothetical protein
MDGSYGTPLAISFHLMNKVSSCLLCYDETYYVVGCEGDGYEEILEPMKLYNPSCRLNIVHGNTRSLSDVLPHLCCSYCRLLFQTENDLQNHRSPLSQDIPPCGFKFQCAKEKRDTAANHTGTWRSNLCETRGCKSQGFQVNPTTCEKSHLLGLEERKEATEDTTRRNFISFINTQCENASKETVARIMELINEVCHKESMTVSAEYAGSAKKHTDVTGYSDVDIWLHTTGPISQKNRKRICRKIVCRLAEVFPGAQVVKYKPNATAVSCHGIDFDLVFGDATYATREMAPPDNSAFHNRPDRQNAVRALKLLSKLVSVAPLPCTLLTLRFRTAAKTHFPSAREWFSRSLLRKFLASKLPMTILAGISFFLVSRRSRRTVR